MDQEKHEDEYNGEAEREEEVDEESEEFHKAPRELPPDLPRTLDDRKNFNSYNEETEYYDAWQGMYSKLKRSEYPC